MDSKVSASKADPVVISGVGIAASLGSHREEVWQAIQRGRSGVRLTRASDQIGALRIPCAMADWLPAEPPGSRSLKSIRMCRTAAAEALDDADIDWRRVDRGRFACSVAAQFGDIGYLYLDQDQRVADPSLLEHAWHKEFLPSSISDSVAGHFGLYGPRLCYATACASGVVSLLAAARMIEEDQADMALAGAADAVTEIILTSFYRMGVLAEGDNPAEACRPFDRGRTGFVMGEGAGLMVLERRSHAKARGAKIYAEIAAGQMLCQAHHVTSLEDDCATLEQLIRRTVRKAGWQEPPQYINAHGTGTKQNDFSELRAIRAALGSDADQVIASSNKAVLGHLINAAGSIELALATLAMRDGFAPPTMHLQDPEIEGQIDCLAQYGVQQPLQRVLKLSQAFGGHLVGVALNQPNDASLARQPIPLVSDARVRSRLDVRRRAA
ncbi:MAG: beta-ketoacyl-[acyl-carrier-protein] synthase family protein [Pirellulaceae bacterium]|nr:beta-ketoacyl-[acyl-carrier-protein] synthase family protein [Pirellulaceae bacterium]